jgi:hypothetical protein
MRGYWQRRAPAAGRAGGVISVFRRLAADGQVRRPAARAVHAVEAVASHTPAAIEAVRHGAGAIVERTPEARSKVVRGSHEIVRRGQGVGARLREVRTPRLRLATWPSVFAAACAGALVMYYSDPSQGRRRRALVRDRFAHWGHLVRGQVPRRLEQRGRFFRGVARGVSHDAARLVHRNGHAGVADDETLVARVRSEVLRDGRVKAGEIHIDAYEGCVTLRGQVDRESDKRRLVDATRRVAGVTDVRSYLHLPDEPPPNKAESYEHAIRGMPAI